MKKLAVYLFLIITALFTSCSNDDDTPMVTDESLIPGEWRLTDTRSENGQFSTTLQGIPLTGTYTISGRDYTATATFVLANAENEPNTVTGSGGFTLVANFTVPTQDPIEIEEVVPDLIGTGEWSVTGNMLAVTAQGETQQYEIVELTSQQMTLKITIDEERTIEQLDNITATITGEQFFVLTKQ